MDSNLPIKSKQISALSESKHKITDPSGCFHEINFQFVNDKRGNLTIFDFKKHSPFEPQRFFYVQNAAGVRGQHAHRTTSEVILMLSGSLQLSLDDGKNRLSSIFKEGDKGIFIPKMTWVELKDFSNNCCYAVFADEPYDESGYLKSYELFLREVEYAS